MRTTRILAGLLAGSALTLAASAGADPYPEGKDLFGTKSALADAGILLSAPSACQSDSVPGVVARLKSAETEWLRTTSNASERFHNVGSENAGIGTAADEDLWEKRMLESDAEYKKVKAAREALEHLPACPDPLPPAEVSGDGSIDFSGLSVGVGVAFDWGDQSLVERFAATGVVTNAFSNAGNITGISFDVGYGIPLPNGLVLTPFASLDLTGQTIEQTFPGGSFIGSESRFIATGGAKIGLIPLDDLEVHALAGVSVLSENLVINFGGPVTSITETVTGATAGVGANFLTDMALFGNPLTVFVEYQHYWWQDAHLTTPPSSPLFNYNFVREDDTVKFGVRYFIGRPQ